MRNRQIVQITVFGIAEDRSGRLEPKRKLTLSFSTVLKYSLSAYLSFQQGVDFLSLTDIDEDDDGPTLLITEPYISEVEYQPGGFYENQELSLSPGDELLIGSTSMKLGPIYREESWNSLKQFQTHDKSAICRICQEEGTDLDQMVGLCACKGDTRYVHIDCLRKWNQSRCASPDADFKVWRFSRAKLKCEICKFEYLSNLDISIPELLDERMKSRSLTLVTISSRTISPSYYLVRLSESGVVIGRSAASDIILNDDRVEKSHCELRFVEGILKVRDRGSFVGTFVKYSKPISLLLHPKLTLKFREMVIEVKIGRVGRRNDHY